MATKVYPAHGWLPAGAHIEWQRDDQGKDFVTNWKGAVQAPGDGRCVSNLSDNPFPNGFGPHYPVVFIETGPFAGHYWYIGHTTSAVTPGERFSFGHVLSHADQGHDFEGTHGGWIELGEAPGGRPGPNASSHWYDKTLRTPLVVKVPDPPLKFGDKGLKVLRMSWWLVNCGWLKRPWFHFNRPVHGAVVAFQKFHHLPADGIVGARTHLALQHASDLCRKRHKKEHTA